MTKNKLLNYKGLEREVESLSNRLKREDNMELIELYQKALEECVADKIEIEAWVQSIEDSLTRQAIRLRYIDGMTWNKVAINMVYMTADAARMRATRAIERELNNGK